MPLQYPPCLIDSNALIFTINERMKKTRENRKELGMCQYQVWTFPEYKNKIKEFVEKLKKQHEPK